MNDTQRLAGVLATLLAGLASGVGHAAAAIMVSQMITAQLMEGRTALNDDERAKLLQDDDLARTALQAWLDAKREA